MVPPISLMAATEFLRRALHARDVRRDLVGRLGGLAGQRFDLGGDDGKAATGLAGARRLDGRIQRQKIGLLGDRRDQLDHVADLLRGARQFADAPVGLLRLQHGGFRDLLDSRTRRPISSTEVESSSVAVATDCMLLEASSEAPATWLDRLWVVSAVRVSVPAACSS